MAQNNMSHESKMYVAPNPETHFEELFRVVQQQDVNNNNNNAIQPLNNVPMRQRNFPESFFRPPSCSSSASHSRESSLDATFNSNFVNKNNHSSAKPPTTPHRNNNNNHHNISSPPFVHQKAHSLPASLPNQKLTFTPITNLDNNKSLVKTQPAAPPPPSPKQYRHQQQLKLANANLTNNNNFHFRQQSYDIDKIPLPDGWTMSFDSNGERYFIDHKRKLTTWDDPRIKITQQNFTNLAQNPTNSIINHPNPVASYHQHQSSQPVQPSPALISHNSDSSFYGLSLDNHFTTLPDSGLQFDSNMIAIPTEIASVTEKMKDQILTDDTNQQQQQQLFDPQLQYLTELRMEREKMRNRAEILKTNPMVRSDYLPSLQTLPKSSNNKDSTTTTSMMMHGRQESQDSGLGGSTTSGTLNSINFPNEANLLTGIQVLLF